MSLIYEPRGKAREYSPLALNTYTNGCDHQCSYCYCKSINARFGRPWTDSPKPRNLSGLEAEAKQHDQQIQLCFVGDPFCSAEREHSNTRKALEVLADARCSVSLLTKAGRRALWYTALYKQWPGDRIKVGATLTFLSESKSLEVEPGAATPSERIDMLAALHEAGVQTWASIEPVLDPSESLAIINAALPYVDAFKVGKLNHQKTDTDWSDFGIRAVKMIRAAGRRLYVKDDLRKYLPAGFLTPQESDCDSLNLPPRPGVGGLFE